MPSNHQLNLSLEQSGARLLLHMIFIYIRYAKERSSKAGQGTNLEKRVFPMNTVQ